MPQTGVGHAQIQKATAEEAVTLPHKKGLVPAQPHQGPYPGDDRGDYLLEPRSRGADGRISLNGDIPA